MNFKRVLALTLALFLLLGCFSGCNETTSSSNTQTVSSVDSGEKELSGERQVIKWMVWGSSEGWEERVRLLYELYPEYEQKYDIQVEVGGQGDAEVAQKLRLALSANTDIPDIVQFNYSGMLSFASVGALADISDFMEPHMDELVEGAQKLVTYEDSVIGFPVALKSKLWFYRKDMFDEAGIDPNEIKTEDDFIEAGKKLNEKFPGSYIWNIGPTIAGYDLGMVLSGNGGRFSDDEGNYIVASDPGVRQAFEFFKRLVDENVVLDVSDFTPDWERAFADGSLASTLNASWFAGDSYLPVYAPDQAGKWAVAQWPEVAGSVGGSDAGGSLSCIPAKAANKEAAMDILYKITFDLDLRKAIFDVQPEQLPLTEEALLDPYFTQANKYFGESLIAEREVSLDADHFKLFNYSPASSLEFTLMNQYLDIYLKGEMSLDEVLKNAENDMKTQIGNPLEYGS